jgi:hypothetical protein
MRLPELQECMELLLPVSKGIASYVPGLYALRSRRRHVQAANAKILL